jgi:hypothetical protein
MGRKITGKPMGRSTIDFDITQFEELCKIQCTEAEIAAVLKMSVDTLSRCIQEVYKHTFADVYAQKREGGKASLRRAQWNTALETKNPVMQIFLGKNMLGQADKQEIDQHNTGNIEVTFSDPQLDEWAK